MPQRKTRKRQRTAADIQHHHFLLRMETQSCPSKTDRRAAAHMLRQIIKDINMKALDKPRVYYVEHPHYNEGLTAIAPIETSHIAFHFWSRPDPTIFHNPTSRCLLQLDIYTCSSLTIRDIQSVLHHLTKFRPTHVNATLINRQMALSIERTDRWDSRRDTVTWPDWLDRLTSSR